jgi:hypothetical protein
MEGVIENYFFVIAVAIDFLLLIVFLSLLPLILGKPYK